MFGLTSLIQRLLKSWAQPCKATPKYLEYSAQGAVLAIFNFPFLDWSQTGQNWEKSILLVMSYIPFNSSFVFQEWGTGWAENTSKFSLALDLGKKESK